MLRPTTLFRAVAAAPRHILPQPTATTFLARRFLTTTPSSTPAPEPAATTPLETPSSSSSPTQTPSPTVRQRTPSPPKGTFPFHIGRTPSNNFAVYQLAKRGGNKLLTVIKKVEGDASTFQDALASGLALGEGVVTYNQHTRHVILAVRSPSPQVTWASETDQIRLLTGVVQYRAIAGLRLWSGLRSRGFEE